MYHGNREADKTWASSAEQLHGDHSEKGMLPCRSFWWTKQGKRRQKGKKNDKKETKRRKHKDAVAFFGAGRGGTAGTPQQDLYVEQAKTKFLGHSVLMEENPKATPRVVSGISWESRKDATMRFRMRNCTRSRLPGLYIFVLPTKPKGGYPLTGPTPISILEKV